MISNRLLTFIFCLLCTTLVQSQSSEIGLQIGSSYYFGEINPNISFDEPSYSSSIFYRRNFDKRTSVRGQFSYARLVGDDANSKSSFQQARNLSFRTDIIELSAVYEFNFFNYTAGDRDEWFTPFLFVGAGAMYFNPQAELDGDWHSLRPLTTEGQEEEYEAISPLGIYGIGMKYNINSNWSINGEFGNRFLFHDYLDDISTTYTNRETLRENRGDIAATLSDRSTEVNPDGLSREGFQRGNSEIADNYLFIQVGISYTFNPIKCPVLH